MRARSLALLLAVAAIAAEGGRALAEPTEAAVPRAEGLVLDGAMAEDAWAKAAVLPAETIEGPRGEPIRADVRVLVAGGRLWVGITVTEDPGLAMGVRWMAAPEGTKSAADAVALAYSPLETRAPRYVAHGPRGIGRATVRFAGAADLSKSGSWSLETCVALADLAPTADDAPIRLAVAVAARTPDRLAASPPGAIFAPPSAWALLRPPAAGWGLKDDPGFDPAAHAALAAEDAKDEERRAEFRAFLDLQAKSPDVATARRDAFPHLEAAIQARPDLATLVTLRGDVLARLGEHDAATASYAEALRLVPNLREARWGLSRLRASRWTDRLGTEPSDYAAALARIDAEAPDLARDDPAREMARATLLYRQGAFEEARRLFGGLASRFPGEPSLAEAERRCRTGLDLWGNEGSFRAASRDDLPRVRLHTSRGAVVVELFEDDAPNTVANFLWVADRAENGEVAFLDGTRFHRVVPFAFAEAGDPTSRGAGPASGRGGPGWAIAPEAVTRVAGQGADRRRPRAPFRGAIAATSDGEDSAGSRFFLTTGSMLERFGETTVFGRIVEGQEVADRLVEGDLLERVEVLRKRAHAYRPITKAGEPAPPPRH